MTAETLPREKPRLRVVKDAATESVEQAVRNVDLEAIEIGPNVRVNVEGIDELAASVESLGVLQPIKVRYRSAAERDRFVVVWGQRRFLASKKAGRTTIPAIVVDEEKAGDQLSIEQLVENLHRADLNPLDRAKAMKAVVDGGMKQVDLAKQLGLAASTVANDIGILRMPAIVQGLLEEGRITPAHIRSISGLPEGDAIRLAKSAAEGNYSAHGLEDQARYIRSNLNESAKREKEVKAGIARGLAVLEAAKVAKDLPLFVTARSWRIPDDKLKAAVTAAGYTVAGGWGWGHTERWSGCDCTTLRLEVGDGDKDTKLEPACASDEHRRALDTERTKAQREKDDVAEAERKAFGKAVDVALGRGSIDPIVARLILRALEGYYGKTWTEYAGLDDKAVTNAIAAKLSSPHTLRGATYNGDSHRLPIKTIAKALAGETAVADKPKKLTRPQLRKGGDPVEEPAAE